MMEEGIDCTERTVKNGFKFKSIILRLLIFTAHSDIQRLGFRAVSEYAYLIFCNLAQVTHYEIAHFRAYNSKLRIFELLNRLFDGTSTRHTLKSSPVTFQRNP